MNIVHRVRLYRTGLPPRSAETVEAIFHLAQYKQRLRSEPSGREIAARDDVIRKFSALRPLAAAGDDETRAGIVGGNGVTEGVEARFGRRSELRCNVGARD